jgi:hypothetical protein
MKTEFLSEALFNEVTCRRFRDKRNETRETAVVFIKVTSTIHTSLAPNAYFCE